MNNVFEDGIFCIKYNEEQNSRQDNSWIAKIRLNHIGGSIKNNNSEAYCCTQMNLQLDLNVIPKGSSTESDHSVGVTDEWQMGGLK
jgi:hypothetical protein